VNTPTRPAAATDNAPIDRVYIQAPKLPADLLLLVALSLKSEPMSALVAAAKSARAS